MPAHEPQRLRNASVHLHYEVRMLVATAEALATADDGPIRYALIESFAIHARALIDVFFRETSNDKTDVLAAHYIDGWKAPNKPAALQKVHHRTAKEIVHLTYDRIDKNPGTWGWQILEMRDAILTAVSTFLAAVPADCIDQAAWDGWRPPPPVNARHVVYDALLTTGPTVTTAHAFSVNTPTINPAHRTSRPD